MTSTDPAPDDGAEVSEPVRPRRRWLRRIAIVVLLVLAAGVLYGVVTFAQVYAASRGDHARKADAIVVLGAAQYNGRPSPVLEARLKRALQLYEAGLSDVIVVTGGRQSGDTFTEATTGYNWLRRRGVPDSAIRKEVQGRSTYESLAATQRFLADEDRTSVVLVSSPAHSRRLLDIAHEVGLTAVTSPAGRNLNSRMGELRALARETVAVGLGRIISYRRLDWRH